MNREFNSLFVGAVFGVLRSIIERSSCRKLARVLPFCLVLVSCFSQASEIKIDGGIYHSGVERYAILKQSDAYRAIDGHFLVVPLDYKDQRRGSFDLFYRLSANFDRKKPTVIYFTGGPGISSFDISFERDLPQFNFVYFDYRGAGYSHLRNLKDAENPSNFSSELIAQDADFLLRKLGLSQVAVWGHSYGTVPATIYANRFSAHVNAVLLEGTVYEGSPDFWVSPETVRLVQNYYDQLSPETKAKIPMLDLDHGWPKFWFYQMVRFSTMLSNFKGSSDTALGENLANAGLYHFNRATVTPESDSTEIGALMYQQIACQELSVGDPRTAFSASLEGDKIVPYADPKSREVCLSIPGMAEKMNHVYQAANYPLSMPVTYIHGTTDGWAAPSGAMKHFKSVARGPSQLIYVKNGGHVSAIGCVQRSVAEPDWSIGCQDEPQIAEALTLGLLGKNIPDSLLKKMSQKNPWVKASKLRSKIPRD